LFLLYSTPYLIVAIPVGYINIVVLEVVPRRVVVAAVLATPVTFANTISEAVPDIVIPLLNVYVSLVDVAELAKVELANKIDEVEDR
jgi:hypothetical protein